MKKSDQFTPVRFSHLTAYAGVGSIVRDNNDFTMTVTDIRYWTKRDGSTSTEPIRNVVRVKGHLEISKDLRMPPIAQVEKDRIIGNPLPAVIFPGYTICKSCNLLHQQPWHGVEKEISKDLLCDICKKPNLEQVTWCAVSSDGDLSDVPWHSICHAKSSTKCEPDYSSAYLEIVPGQKGKKKVICTRDGCGASNSFEQSDTKLTGTHQPWIKGNNEEDERKIFTVMEINDPRVYSANKKRAIVIPPESNIDKDSVAYKLTCDSVLLNKIQQESYGLKRKKILLSAADKLHCTVKEVRVAVSDLENSLAENENLTFGEMYSDEYKALMEDEDYKEGVDFVTKHKTNEWRNYLDKITIIGDLEKVSNLVCDLVSVDRLRVIEVFKGFSRRASDHDDLAENIVPPDITGELDWLPAIELFGEGIFFTINQSILSKWEDIDEIRLRADELSRRYEDSSEGPFENLPVVSPRFILLHTLAHLIIRELEISSGYPAASLKERIYSSKSEKMAGILIYTAVADVAGSLGGIVEATEPEKFLKLLDGVFKHAQWCSLDPVCTEHEGQGPGWLNRAACHACSLIPETSCEYGNVFLDRVFVKGNKRTNIPSLIDVIGMDNG